MLNTSPTAPCYCLRGRETFPPSTPPPLHPSIHSLRQAAALISVVHAAAERKTVLCRPLSVRNSLQAAQERLATVSLCSATSFYLQLRCSLLTFLLWFGLNVLSVYMCVHYIMCIYDTRAGGASVYYVSNRSVRSSCSSRVALTT